MASWDTRRARVARCKVPFRLSAQDGGGHGVDHAQDGVGGDRLVAARSRRAGPRQQHEAVDSELLVELGRLGVEAADGVTLSSSRPSSAGRS